MKFKSFLDDNEKSLDKISEKEASNLLSMMEKNEEEMYQNKRNLISNLKAKSMMQTRRSRAKLK